MLNSNNGWIKISRSISEHWLWDDTEMLKWWLDFIILAAWKPRKVLDGGELIELQRGQFISSTRCLQIRWAKKDKRGNIVEKPSLKRVTHFLQLLEAEKMITRSFRKHQTTVVTVCNYASYQITDDECYNTLGNTLGNTCGNTCGNKIEEYKEYKEERTLTSSMSKNKFLDVESATTQAREKAKKLDLAALVAYFNNAVKGKLIPPIRKITGQRETFTKARLAEYGKEAIRTVIDKAAASSFLNGGGDKAFVASFEWIMRPNNFPKVLDGYYDNELRQNKASQNINANGTTKTDRQRAEDEYNAEFERYVRAKLAGDGVQE